MSQPEPDAGATPEAADEQTRERLRVITQETRFVLLQNIIGHPHQLPSLAELEHVNPSKARSTIVEHLEELIEAGIVERVEYEPNKSENDLPHVFFGLTEEGEDFLEAHRLFRAKETLRHFYDAVTKPEEIERYETAPRPE